MWPRYIARNSMKGGKLLTDGKIQEILRHTVAGVRIPVQDGIKRLMYDVVRFIGIEAERKRVPVQLGIIPVVQQADIEGRHGDFSFPGARTIPPGFTGTDRYR